MSAHTNPFFKNVERSSYEIGHLLKNLPRDFSPYKEHSSEVYQMAAAIGAHTGNALSALTHGMEAIGQMIFTASGNDDYPLDSRTLADIGTLIKYLAVEIQLMSELEGEFSEINEKKKQTAAKKKGGE